MDTQISSTYIWRTSLYFSKQVRVWLTKLMKYSVSLVRLWNPLVTQSAQQEEKTAGR